MIQPQLPKITYAKLIKAIVQFLRWYYTEVK